MNNATLLTADFAAHIKIIAIALAATMVIAALIGIGARTRTDGSEPLVQTTDQVVAPGT